MSSLRNNIKQGFQGERISELLIRTNEFGSTSIIYDTNEWFVTKRSAGYEPNRCQLIMNKGMKL